MKCEIVNFMVSVNPYSVSAGVGPMRAYCRCNTHGMQDFAPSTYDGMLCPVGKIEQAVEDGLAKIAAALTSAIGKLT
jgi:hypothetical protein